MEWDIPRVPLGYDRAVIASIALTNQLRAARGAGRARYYEGVVAHQQAAMPEQLLPFPIADVDADAEESEGEPADYMERLRALRKKRAKTGGQDLTAEQISSIQIRIEKMKKRGAPRALRTPPRSFHSPTGPRGPGARAASREARHRTRRGEPLSEPSPT